MNLLHPKYRAWCIADVGKVSISTESAVGIAVSIATAGTGVITLITNALPQLQGHYCKG